MSELYFVDCNSMGAKVKWLKAKDLVEGKAYIAKDGRLLIYLGVVSDGSVLFYRVCNLAFKSLYVNNMDYLGIANYSIQVPSAINMCNAAMSSAPFKESFIRLKKIPDLYTEFNMVDYTNSYLTWYTKSKMMLPDIPLLAKAAGVAPDNLFVKTKDLIVGHAYYSGDSWRSTYIYLGRTSNNDFVWYFVGNADYLYAKDLTYFLKNSDTTKSNKKVKDMANIRSDKDAYITDEVVTILNHNCCINTNGLTQEILDYWVK